MTPEVDVDARSSHGATTETSSEAAAGQLSALLLALRRLDLLIARAIAAAEATFGPEAAADAYHGLYISPEKVQQLLTHQPNKPTLWTDPPKNADPSEYDPSSGGDVSGPRLAWLQRTHDLSPFDSDMILITLAP